MWMRYGTEMVVFLDHGLSGGANELIARNQSLKWVHSDLIRFGFHAILAKSQCDPSHVIVWLGKGNVIDTIKGTIAASLQRMLKLLNLILFISLAIVIHA